MGNSTEETNRRCEVINKSEINKEIVSSLQNMLHSINYKVKSFIYAKEELNENCNEL